MYPFPLAAVDTGPLWLRLATAVMTGFSSVNVVAVSLLVLVLLLLLWEAALVWGSLLGLGTSARPAAAAAAAQTLECCVTFHSRAVSRVSRAVVS